MPTKGEKSGIIVDCEVCGRQFYKTQSWAARSRHHFCGRDCYLEYSRTTHKEARHCEVCGTLFYATKSQPKRFCSPPCQWEWQKGNRGEKHQSYSRVSVDCTWCGKPHKVKAYKQDYERHFCSGECRRAWYSAVFSKSEAWREESRRRAVRILESGLISKTNSAPQRIVDAILEKNNIEHIREHNIVYYTVDNYLVRHNLFIEVMGDFWHCNPTKYQSPKYERQQKVVRRDKAKRTYAINQYGINILYLWECDISNRADVCEALIQLYIANDGVLSNYQSFNYHISDGVIRLKDTIIESFFERDMAA